MFQFLIGRLETTRLRMVVSMSTPGFQFLIGRLETGREKGEGISLEVFQFLIGRLETI